MLVQDAQLSIRLFDKYLRRAPILDIFFDILPERSRHAIGMEFEYVARHRRGLADQVYFDLTQLHADTRLWVKVLALAPRHRQPAGLGA